MATLKHIASKNSDYTAIEAYLIYQHDAFTGKQLLDDHGRPMLRESYILDTLECGDFSFATACLLANRKYGKNNQHGDIKSHQYIISFDPRDAADNGLTMEKAQALGLKFCEENFPGHPSIVCTHPDGHNHSGNIHVHIVIGSIRTREVERKSYMQKPGDWREGMKHSSTAQTMRHLRVEVMELCEGAGLYQIDLLNGSKERVSEAEYWVRRRGQLKLDRENAALTAAGQPPRQKKFETVKETLRRQISSVLYRATSFEEFSDRLMQQYGIAVKESRGRLSYLPAGRTKFIRARSIGDKFEKIRIEILRRERNAEETKAEVLKMRQRMHDGHPNKTELFDVKHDEGGMVDVEFIVQYLVLQYSAKFPQLVNNFGNIKMLEMVSDAGLIPKDLAFEVSAIYRKYRRIQHEFRLNSPSVPVRVPKEEFADDAAKVRELWSLVFGPSEGQEA